MTDTSSLLRYVANLPKLDDFHKEYLIAELWSKWSVERDRYNELGKKFESLTKYTKELEKELIGQAAYPHNGKYVINDDDRKNLKALGISDHMINDYLNKKNNVFDDCEED